MTQTEEIFNKHNQELMKNLIPDDNQMPNAKFCIDPNDEIFYKSFDQIVWERKDNQQN